MKLSKYMNRISFQKLYFYLLAILILRLDLISLNTMPTGGDMGAHVVPIKYFIDNFALNFQLNGWSNDWFAGYPLYFFYFPFPAILTFFLDLIFPYGIAFKLMVTGSIILVIYSFERLFRKNQSDFAIMGFVAGLTYVLTESFTIYGGNLASTLAGQFSFTYSIGFANLAIAYISKGNNKNKHVISALFLGMSLLSHLIPFLIYSSIYFYYWIKEKTTVIEKSSSVLVFTFLSARFLTSLIANLEYTTNMSYTPYTKLADLIKSDITPFLLASVFIFFFNFKEIYLKKETSFFEWFMLFSSIILYFFVPEGALWNGRIVSFLNLAVIVLFFKIFESQIENIIKYEQGGISLKVITIVLLIVYFFNFFQKWNISSFRIFLYPLLVMFVVGILYFLPSSTDIIKLTTAGLIIFTITFLPYWVSWNFNGYENKDQWSDIENLYSNLNQLSPGRIMWEPNSDLNKYGTPMVLMTIPLYTDHSSMEGLYFDSSITTPFHFIAVSGLAERPSNPVGGLRYINNQFEKGEEYLLDLGIDYFISYTELITKKAHESSKLIHLFSSGPFTVFKIDSELIELVNQEIIEFEKVPYLDRTLSSLFRDTTYSNFFTESYENFENLSFQRIIETTSISPQLKKSISDEVSITGLTITSDKIKFSTNKPNELHLIKVSYFPNWEIVNGEGPYRISPSFMAVVPYSENVEINFVKTKLESFSFYIALLSLLLFTNLSARKKLNEQSFGIYKK